MFFKNSRFGIGSTYSLNEIDDPKSPTGKRTNIAYLLRAYVHSEYGRTTDPGDKMDVSVKDFFRVGPKVELTLDPLFTDRLTASVSYEYLANIAGTSSHNHLFKASAEYRITTADDVKKNPFVPLMSLRVTYEDGGIDLTNERVKTLLVGLGVTL